MCTRVIADGKEIETARELAAWLGVEPQALLVPHRRTPTEFPSGWVAITLIWRP